MMNICFKITDGDQVRELGGSLDGSATVLDALETLRVEGQSPVPAYRHSCHHGSCGTCGAIINGLEGLMCLTRLGELALPRSRLPGGARIEPELAADGSLIVRLEPVRRGSLVAGIAARPSQALSGIPADLPYLMQLGTGSTGGMVASEAGGPAGSPADSKADGKANLPGDPTRLAPACGVDGMPPVAGGPPARVRFEACIECGLCSSSCPVAVPFMGPAALAALNRQRQKHPESSEALLALAGTADGAAACERHLACSRVCPQNVYPGKHIQLLKNALGSRA